jgi:hypothetical protein
MNLRFPTLKYREYGRAEIVLGSFCDGSEETWK